MSKETYYFSHDFNSRNDDKIQVLLIDYGAESYGIFWAITEILHEEENHKIELSDIFYKSFAKQMSTSVEQVVSILRSAIQYDLFYQINEENKIFIASNRVNKNVTLRDELSNKRSKAGKESALKRALLKESSTSVKQVLTNDEQVSTKERKGKENKGKENKRKKKEIDIYFDFKSTLLEIAKEELVNDWLIVRKNKKASNTKTAYLKFMSEVEKCQKDINEILEICITKSWSGFNAEWLKNVSELNKINNNQNQPYKRHILENDF